VRHWWDPLTSQTHQVIEEAAESLKWAWETDEKDRKSYPVNTSHAFAELTRQIKEIPRSTETRIKPTLRDFLARRRQPPTSFSELISEEVIRAIYEDQNADSYQNALKRAASRHSPTFFKILKAIREAYFVECYGTEPPRPKKTNFLHRGLLDIANLAGLTALTAEQLADFFDKICPCGKEHDPDAIRKLRGRWKRRSRPQSSS